MKLVIVESPTKAKTISSFLDKKQFSVISSYGHIRDLPKSKLGIDIENNFEPQYIIPTKTRKKITEIKKAAEKSEEVILATDEDREGEAIAWHIANVLNIKPEGAKRIVFHEITKQEILKSIKNPRNIDIRLVNAQQARRILDRLVGYKLSPFLWKKVARGLSAGRVQSVALRIIVDREKEINAFVPQEYWTITAECKNKNNDLFSATLSKINGKKIEIGDIPNGKLAQDISESLSKAKLKVEKINKKITRKTPPPPFITSSLQQEAYKKLRFSSKQTMGVAQKLYENGFITYMRTDSYNISKEAASIAKDFIKKKIGENYIETTKRKYKSKTGAQEAHEAIRPTNPKLTPEEFEKKAKTKYEAKLYNLIWKRFIASQMKEAELYSTKIEISAKSDKEYTLSSNGTTIKFDGFTKVWEVSITETVLPNLNEGEAVSLIKTIPEQHFTQPPARYNEASLIKTLEEYGIGRPSTYAPIISVIQERNYVIKNEQKRFEPTEIGIKVNNLLVEHFPKIVDIKFTSEMEKGLDLIAEGKKEWREVIKSFYIPFEKELEEKYESVKSQKPEPEYTDEKCEKCGSQMVIKFSRFGKFLACSNFPKCKNTKPISNDKTQESFGKCPKCNEGDIIKIRTRKGKIFYGCSRYPDCNYASWKKPEINKK